MVRIVLDDRGMTNPPHPAPLSVIVLGLDPAPSDPKLLAQLLDTTPEALWLDAHMVALVRPGPEIEAVIDAERLRHKANQQGLTLSLGVSCRERATGPLSRTLDEARVAYDFALALGGNLTLAYSSILDRPRGVAA